MPFLGLQVLWGELRGPGSQREPPAKDEAHGNRGWDTLPTPLQKDGGGKSRVLGLLG